jgi:putative endonuclease
MSKNLGDRGETLVAQLLQANGWQILAQQWRCRWGELDLVARDRQWLIFVEVKTRSDGNWDENGTLAINQQKQGKLIKSASLFLSQNPQFKDLSCRFDVAIIKSRSQPQDKSFNNQALELYLKEYIEQAFTP